ncbi:MAG: orotidine-5'-phosphate decarboxylase [Salibacteraceae bacterium]
MTRAELIQEIKTKESFLCVGLDSDLNKIPSHLLELEDPIFEFNKQIIDNTKDFCVAYKPNIAFYESMGLKGWESLRKTLDYIPDNCFTIADAKRGDIGNTASMYAKAFFDKKSSGMEFDSITIAPYMGADSVTPFLQFDGKWGILLALTSNPGSNDFQQIESANGQLLFEEVLTTSQNWGSAEQLMYVVGATRGEDIGKVRALAKEHFFLVPGVGAQGGSLDDVVKFGMNSDCGLLINSSRGIIYASNHEDFGVKAGQEAKKLQEQMSTHLKTNKII